MLTEEQLKRLETVAKYTRHDGTLLSLIENPSYPIRVKVLAAKNVHLSSSSLSRIINHANEFDKEVLVAVLKHSSISRADIKRMSQYHDSDVALAAIRSNLDLSGYRSVLSGAIFDSRIELSKAALEAVIDQVDYNNAEALSAAMPDILSVVIDGPNRAWPSQVKRDMDSIALRVLSDPVLLHILVSTGGVTRQEMLSKNPYLAPATIQVLLDGRNREVKMNLIQFTNLTHDQISVLIDQARKAKDFEMFMAICQYTTLSSDLVDELLQERKMFFEEIVESRMPFLTQDAKDVAVENLEKQVSEAISQNQHLTQDMISEQYGIELQPRIASKVGLEGLDLHAEGLTPIALYEDLNDRVMDEVDIDELLRVADQTDIDPDIQKTVMLALVNKNVNSIGKLNAIHNSFKALDGFVNMVGGFSCDMQKQNRVFIQSSTLGAFMKGRMFVHNAARSIVSKVSSLAESVDRVVQQVRTKTPTTEMTDRNITKEVFKKMSDGVKSIKLIKRDKNKKGRRR